MAIHFVGFRTDAEYLAAVRAFDIDMDNDMIVLGTKGRENPCKFSDQDHERH